MLRSLRFRLPALFLIGFAVAGLVSTAIALRLFQNYTRDRAVAVLARESRGVVSLYGKQAGREAAVPSKKLQEAIGDRIFYIEPVEGLTPFPGDSPFPVLKRRVLTDAQFSRLASGFPVKVEFEPPGGSRTYVAVARPFLFAHHFFGAIVIATPKNSLRTPWAALIERLALALAAGLVVATLLSVYLSRRITRPLSALSEAADEVATGRYDIEVPVVPGGDEIAHLADRFREMAARLGEAEELERNFLMSVSHELRTPLTAIRGHVAALREGVFDDPEAQESSLAVVAAETERLERLVGDVLDLAKLDARRFTLLQEEVDMERLCDRAYAAFGEQARQRSIDYRHTVDAHPVIVTDGDRVLQIISNLLANAFRWTPAGGRVELALAQAHGTVSVDVVDSGPGISPSARERIFRPFFSLDDGGTGLGLAIAHELAVALGGRLEVDSELGRGSRFRLVLPATPAGEPSPWPEETRPAPEPEPVRVA
jgi:signal transduction histidine kinase